MWVSSEGESTSWFCMHRGCVHVEHGSHALPTLQCPAPAIHGSSIRFVLQKEDWSEQVNHPLSCHYSTLCDQVTGPWHASIGSLKSQSEIWIPLPVNLFIGIVLVHALVWPGAPLICSFFCLLDLLLVVPGFQPHANLGLCFWFTNYFFPFFLNVSNNYNLLTCSYARCLELKGMLIYTLPP
jgi:hypothetical protein